MKYTIKPEFIDTLAYGMSVDEKTIFDWDDFSTILSDGEISAVELMDMLVEVSR